MELDVREAKTADLAALLALYTGLHHEEPPERGAALAAWTAIQADPGHHLLLGCVDGRAVCSCVLVVIPNLTHGARPYGLVENVVTRPEDRGRGYATSLLHRATEIAWDAGCYKVMLLTGRKDAATLDFYRKAGFNSEDKTGFVQWL